MAALSRGVDRAAAFSDDEWRTLAPFGIQWTTVYIGGRCSAGVGWTPGRVRSLAALGARFLPLYVGAQVPRICGYSTLSDAAGRLDGKVAATLADAYGFDKTTPPPLGLDVEYATSHDAPTSTLAYALAWCATVRAGGYSPYVYGSRDFARLMLTYPQAFDAWHLADWVGTAMDWTVDLESVIRDVLGGADTSHGLAWQYAHAVNVAGLSGAVDVSVADIALASVRGVAGVNGGSDNGAGGGVAYMTGAQMRTLVQALEDLGDSIAIYLYRHERGQNVLTGRTGYADSDEADFRAARQAERAKEAVQA